MAHHAVARETFFALRREIARIEGVLPDWLDASATGTGDSVVLRRAGMAQGALLATGVDRFDAALGGGLPRAGLTEIHGIRTREAGTVAGFALALTALARKEGGSVEPLLWIGAADIFREAGAPHAPGLLARFGIANAALLVCEVHRIEDALWVAEEAAGLTALSAVLLEIRGHAPRLDLTATRRLHRRALAAGRPLYLLRQAARPLPTAAPVRLVVSPAPAASRRTLSGPLDGSIGPPAFGVAIAKSRTAIPAEFTLEWNADERAFHERRPRPQDTGAVVPASADRAHPAPQAGAVLAFRGAA